MAEMTFEEKHVERLMGDLNIEKMAPARIAEWGRGLKVWLLEVLQEQRRQIEATAAEYSSGDWAKKFRKWRNKCDRIKGVLLGILQHQSILKLEGKVIGMPEVDSWREWIERILREEADDGDPMQEALGEVRTLMAMYEKKSSLTGIVGRQGLLISPEELEANCPKLAAWLERTEPPAGGKDG